ncbi:MAG TPA: uroporphyrinogen-III C-methyltransferase [Ohtaekwangia sp.]
MIETISIIHKEPRLTLVGAGPGDPELITVKGIKAIQQADVVLYDALVSEDILKLIPSGIQSFPVGKRAGEHSYKQEEINELIVELAYAHGHVVRLKGGDSFVFGRGSEEIEFAEKHGLKTAVIPGLSSVTAVPASLNIPLTSRGVSESFWVVTGTTKEGVLSGDVSLAAQSTATIVILMGLNKVEEIMNLFAKAGKESLPVAVVQNGTLSSQRSVIGIVSTIVELVNVERIASPAIIILGEVVRHAKELEKVLVSVNTDYEQ